MTGTDTLVRALHTDVELPFDEGEWTAFVAGARDGEFDFSPTEPETLGVELVHPVA